jgi:hypothetical protein
MPRVLSPIFDSYLNLLNNLLATVAEIKYSWIVDIIIMQNDEELRRYSDQ